METMQASADDEEVLELEEKINQMRRLASTGRVSVAGFKSLAQNLIWLNVYMDIREGRSFVSY